MLYNQDDAWLRQARIIDALVREELGKMGIEPDPRPFDALVASGDLQAAECRVRSMYMVDPGWSDRPAPEARQKPRLAVVDGAMPPASAPDPASPPSPPSRD